MKGLAMKYYTHILFGFVLAILMYLAVIYLDISITFDYLVVVVIVIIYSILPDIDIKKSKIRKIMMPILIFLVLLFYYTEQYLVMLFVLLVIAFIYSLKHRTLTHTIMFGILVSLPWYQNIVYMLLAFVSYLSHILLDRF